MEIVPKAKTWIVLDKTWYNAGDQINGIFYYWGISPISATQLILEIKGTCISKSTHFWKELLNKKNVKHKELKREENEYFVNKWIIDTFSDSQAPKGNFEYPFSIVLPDNMAPTSAKKFTDKYNMTCYGSNKWNI